MARRQACGGFSCLIMAVGGPSPLWVVPPLQLLVLGCGGKQAEGIMKGKSVSRIPLCSCFHACLPVPALCSSLSDFPSLRIVTTPFCVCFLKRTFSQRGSYQFGHLGLRLGKYLQHLGTQMSSMLSHDFSCREVNKCLLTPDRAPMTCTQV